MTWVDLRMKYQHYKYQCKKNRLVKMATTTPKSHLFNPTGWGVVDATDLRARPYRGPLYPAPLNHVSKFRLEPVSHLCNAARQQWSAANFEKAEETYNEAIAQCPENPDFYFEQGQLLWSEGRLCEAKRLFEEALKLKPDFVAAHTSRFRICVAQHDNNAIFGGWWEFTRHHPEQGVELAFHYKVLPRNGFELASKESRSAALFSPSEC